MVSPTCRIQPCAILVFFPVSCFRHPTKADASVEAEKFDCTTYVAASYNQTQQSEIQACSFKKNLKLRFFVHSSPAYPHACQPTLLQQFRAPLLQAQCRACPLKQLSSSANSSAGDPKPGFVAASRRGLRRSSPNSSASLRTAVIATSQRACA